MKVLALFISTGLLFGVWPLIMNKSGLPGFASAALFAGIVFAFVLPVAITSGQLQQIHLSETLFYAILAAALGAMGLLAFNTGLAEVEPERIGTMFMVMIMIQLSVPAIYQIFLSDDVSLKKIAGIAGAFGVAFLLSS